MLNNKKYIAVSIIIIIFCGILGFNIHDNNKEYVIVESNSDNSSLNDDELLLETDNIETKNEDFVTVYISGEVTNPQVLKIENGKRLVDAVECCGGLTNEADSNAINLALILKEENHYIIPAIGEKININAPNLDANNITFTIDINSATVTDLKTLPGVGDVLAQRIIDKREELGKFSAIEQLMDVSGIGEKKYNDIKDKIILN